MPKFQGTLRDYILARVEVQANGCWWWTGYIRRNGYGAITYQRKVVPVHRLSYEVFKGPIPDGFDLDHECHDPKTCSGGNSCLHRRCFNPDHLALTTDAVNCSKARSVGNRGDTSAAVAALRKIHSERTTCPHGHPKTPGNTLTYKGIPRCRECNRIRSEETNRRLRIK